MMVLCLGVEMPGKFVYFVYGLVINQWTNGVIKVVVAVLLLR